MLIDRLRAAAITANSSGSRGNRVKATFGSTTIIYVGDYYEQEGSTVRKYYYVGGQRIAMREGSSTVYWLLTDHLGSTAITAYSSGGKKAELRYKAWGETRYAWGTTPTTYRFTGQREDATIGLYFYKARYYDPALGRFVQPDTIVPNPGNPQDLNRYSYVRNNPLRYTDPTGRWIFEEEPEDLLVYYGSDLGTLARSWRPSSPNHVVQSAERQEVLERYAARLYTQRGEGKVTDLEFLAQLADYRASFGEPKSFVDDLSRIILGGKGGWHTVFYAPTHRHHLELGDSGFAKHYQDGGNQVNHVWFAVHLGHTSGSLRVVEWYSERHEDPNLPVFGGGRLAIPWFGREIVLAPGGGASYLDHRLSMAGGVLGIKIRTGALDVTRVGHWIRTQWGPRSVIHGPIP